MFDKIQISLKNNIPVHAELKDGLKVYLIEETDSCFVAVIFPCRKSARRYSIKKHEIKGILSYGIPENDI